jgi:hypothetical protein
MEHVWREEMHIGCWWGNLKERDNLEDINVDRIKDNIKMVPGEIECDSWIGLFYLRIGTGGGAVRRGNEISCFIKFWEILSSCGTISFSRRTMLRRHTRYSCLIIVYNIFARFDVYRKTDKNLSVLHIKYALLRTIQTKIQQ